MKKILFFINTLHGGGAEKVLVDLLCGLDNSSYCMTLVTVTGGVYRDKLPEYVECKQLVRGNSAVSHFLAKIVYKLPPKLVYSLVSQKQYDYEIAYLEGFPTKVIASGRKKVRKIAFVHCDVSVTDVLKKQYLDFSKCAMEYAKFDKVCFVSQAARNGFEKTVGKPENAVVVHNVINYAYIHKKAQEETSQIFETIGMKIIAVGRIAKEKAYDRLIRVAAKLEKKYSFQICILGDGGERAYLEQLIQEQSVQSVKLLGYQSNPYALMKQADLFVCSSLFEGYSTAVAESLTLGLPVITTDCAGMNELLDNGKYGVIVENSEQALQEGLERILADRSLYNSMKQAALARRDMMPSTGALQQYERLLGE